MKRNRSLVLLFVAAIGLNAAAQTVTELWQPTRDDTRTKIGTTNYPTFEECKAAVLAHAKQQQIAATYDCSLRLRYTPGSTLPVPTPTPTVPSAPVAGDWVMGQQLGSAALPPRPARGVLTPDPAFKTLVARVTDRADAPVGWARNDYSRRQAFNANNTRQLVSSSNGFWHLHNAQTFAYVGVLRGPAGDAEPQWHPTNPDLLYYLPTNGVGMQLLELNVATGASRVVGDFGARLKAKWPGAAAAWTKSEGSPSADGRYWCFMVDNGSWGSVGVFTWDRDTNTVLGTLSTSGDRPDHVSMSPSGKFCVVSWDGTKGTVAFNPTFTTSKKILHKSEHSDIALLPNGDDAYVAVDYQSSGGDVFMVNLTTGVRTLLFSSYLAGTARAFHFSGKAYGKPGYVLVSAYGQYGGDVKWMDNKVTLVELKANPRIFNVAMHRSVVPTSGYFFEPHATINRNATLVAFTSGWGSTNTADLHAFQARLPAVP
jgi:hypothetical protein